MDCLFFKQLSAIVCRLSGVGFIAGCIAVVGCCLLLLIRCRLSVCGSRVSMSVVAVFTWLPGVGCWLLTVVIGCRSLVSLSMPNSLYSTVLSIKLLFSTPAPQPLSPSIQTDYLVQNKKATFLIPCYVPFFFYGRNACSPLPPLTLPMAPINHFALRASTCRYTNSSPVYT